MRFETVFISVIASSSLLYAGVPDPCEPAASSVVELSTGTPVALASGASIGLLAQDNGEIQVYDISAGTLARAGQMTRPLVREMLLLGDVAFMSYDGDQSVEIIDLADPGLPSTIGSIIFSSEVLDFEFDGSLLYIALGVDGIRIYDVSSPSNPLSIGSVEGVVADDVSVNRGKMLSGGVVYDVIDPSTPSVFSEPGISGMLFGDRIIDNINQGQIIWGLDGSKIDVFFDGKNTSCGGGARYGDVLWRRCASGGDQSPTINSVGTYLFDENSPPTGQSIGTVSLETGIGSMLIGPGTQRALIANNSTLWLSEPGQGVVDFAPLNVNDLIIHEDIVYALGLVGITQYDLSNPGSPVRTATLVRGQAESELRELLSGAGIGVVPIRVIDGFIFPPSILVFDLDTFEEITLPYFNSSSNQYAVAVHGRRIALSSQNAMGYFELDENNQYVPLGDTSGISFSYRVSMFGDVLVSLGNNGTINVFDLSDPSNITMVATLAGAGGFSGEVAMISQEMVALTGNQDVKFFDLSDPSSPVLANAISYPTGSVRTASYADGLLSVVHRLGSFDLGTDMDIYDVSDPSNIELVERLHVDSWVNAFYHTATKRAIPGNTVRVYDACYAPCLADLDGDGSLSFGDISAFIAGLEAHEPFADFTGDGRFNFFDVSAFLQAFAAGCP